MYKYFYLINVTYTEQITFDCDVRP